MFKIFNCVFVPFFFWFCWLSSDALGKVILQNLVKSQLPGWELCAGQLVTFYHHQAMNKIFSTENRVLVSLVGPSKTRKFKRIYNWLKIETFQPKFETFFEEHSQAFDVVMQKQVEKVELVQCVIFEYKDSLKCNGTKYLLIFNDSSEKNSNSKTSVETATAGRYQGLSSNYIKNKLFHQSKPGRDVELLNTLIVLFKPPREVMQVSTLSAQLGLGSKLVDWYRDATPVPYGQLLIELPPRKDDQLRYSTNNGNVPWKCYIPDRLQQSSFSDGEHTKSLYSPSVPISLLHIQKVLTFSLAQKSSSGSSANV